LQTLDDDKSLGDTKQMAWHRKAKPRPYRRPV